MDKKAKIFRTFGIIILIAAGIFVFNSCSNRNQKERDKAYSNLSYVSDELRKMGDLYYDVNGSDYYTLEETLYDVSTKCEELREIVDKLAEQYEDKPYDDGGRWGF